MRVNKASLHIHVSCQTCPVFQQLLKGSCLVKLCFYRSVASFQSINEGLAGSHLLLPSFQSINEGLAGSHLILPSFQSINEGLAGSHLILPSFQSINEGLAGSHLLLLVTKQKTVTYLQSLKKRHSADSVFVTHLTTQFFSQCLEVQRPHHSPRITLLRSFSLETCLLFR